MLYLRALSLNLSSLAFPKTLRSEIYGRIFARGHTVDFFSVSTVITSHRIPEMDIHGRIPLIFCKRIRGGGSTSEMSTCYTDLKNSSEEKVMPQGRYDPVSHQSKYYA